MKNILCFGDGNTYGFNPKTGGRYNADERWCGILQKLLKNNYNIIEEGRNARTVIFKDFDDITTCAVDYLPYCLYKYKNLDMIIFCLGTNDFQTLYRASVNEVIDGMRTMLEFISHSESNKHAKILILAPPKIKKDILCGEFGCLFNDNSVKKSHDFVNRLKNFSKQTNSNFLDTNDLIQSCDDDYIHIDMHSHKKLAHKLALLIKTILPE